MYASQLETYIIRLRTMENYVLIPLLPQEKYHVAESKLA
jgi:hypothetical protein